MDGIGQPAIEGSGNEEYAGDGTPIGAATGATGAVRAAGCVSSAESGRVRAGLAGRNWSLRRRRSWTCSRITGAFSFI